MTALAAAANRKSKYLELQVYPVNALSVIHQGALVAIDSDGYARPATDSATDLRVVGVAEESVTGGAADGDVNVRVRSGRAFLFAATSLTQAMVGTLMVVVDDNTVDDVAGATNDVPVGILINFVSATQGWVFIPVGGLGAGSLNASFATTVTGIVVKNGVVQSVTGT